MHTADDTRGRVRRRRRGGGQWRGQEAQAPGVPARRPPPCARAGMRERRRPARLSPWPPAVGAFHMLCKYYVHDIVYVPRYTHTFTHYTPYAGIIR